MDYQQLKQWDHQYVWHPFTQMQDWCNEEPVIIERGDGVYLIDVNGKRYIDGTASMWTNVHGHHARDEIDQAVKDQLDLIAHSTLLGQSNVPAIVLAKQLIDIAPTGISRVFYSDNGSTAMEVAVKMAIQYWQHCGEPEKNRFITLDLAYHGDTIGAVSIGGVDLFHATYRSLVFDTITSPAPYSYRCPASHEKNDEACKQWALTQMRQQLEANKDKIAAIVMEPLVQGAGGVIVHPKGFLKGVRELADEFDTLLILDEVMTGFGRCGSQWASEQEDVIPDLMAIAKGLTAGYMPMAATLCKEKIYTAFLGHYNEYKTFFHGHTFTGNQIGCALAIANLKFYRDNNFIQQIQERMQLFHQLLESCYELEHVGDVRYCGMTAGIELVRNRETKEPYIMDAQVGMKVCQVARKKGLLIRPLGSTIVLMPILAIGTEDLQSMMDITVESIRDITQ